MKTTFETKRVLSTFNTHADGWDQKSAYIAEKVGESRRLFRLLDRLVKDRDRILDMGCGTGKLGTHLKQIAANTRLVSADTFRLGCSEGHSRRGMLRKLFKLEAIVLCCNAMQMDGNRCEWLPESYICLTVIVD